MAFEFLEGILKITNVVLSLFAAYIAVRMFGTTKKRKLAAWKPLTAALVLFMIQETLGALRAFNIYSSPFLTHIVPGILVCFLIYALSLQIHITLTEK